MRIVLSVSMTVAVALLAACRADMRGLAKGEVKDTWSQASDETYIRTRGIGAAPEGVADQTRRRGLSRNAALVAARYELLQVIKGLRLSGGLTVGQLVQTDGKIQETADRIIAGAEEEQVEWTRDDGAVVLLRLERAKVEQVLRETYPYEQKP